MNAITPFTFDKTAVRAIERDGQPAMLPQLAAIVGPPGKDGSVPLSFEVSGQPLSGHRAVFIADDGRAYLCQPDLTARQCIGLTTGASTQGEPAVIQTANVITEPSWAWIAGKPIWIGPDGTLTQIVPTTGALCQFGSPIGPTSLRIDIQFIALL